MLGLFNPPPQSTAIAIRPQKSSSDDVLARMDQRLGELRGIFWELPYVSFNTEMLKSKPDIYIFNFWVSL